jgi:AcrR family transcriptional regulator
MARTAKAAAQAVRREAFVDVALRLIQVKGYEQMSVQDVLEELDASKGAFYHYFDSKRALLLAAMERMSDVALAAVAPVLNDPHLTALQKLEGFLAGMAQWKAERKELVLATLEVWASDDNAIVRERFRQSMARCLVPVLSSIIRQGLEEGLFTADSPDETARIFLSLVLGFQDVAIELFFARRANTVTFEQVERMFAACGQALDRILGLPAGSFKGLDRDSLRVWFG